MWVIVISFFLLVVLNVKIASSKQNFQPLNFHSTLALRGICAVEIMLGHLFGVTRNLWLFPFGNAGNLVVGLFFLLSGYGLMSRTAEKNEYLQHFLSRRLISILVPVYMAYLLRFIFIIIVERPVVEFGYICKYLFFFEFLSSTGWYIYEIVAFYVLFYLLFKFFNRKDALRILTLLSLLFIIVACIYDISSPWYTSTLCFPLGIFIKQNEKYFSDSLCKKYILNIVACAVIIVVTCTIIVIVTTTSFYPLSRESFIGRIVSDLIARNIASVVFSLLVYLIFVKVRIGNILSATLGKISYEIFLIHPIVLMIDRFFDNDVFYAIVVICLTIFLSWVILPLNTLIKGKLNNLLSCPRRN